MSDTAAIWKKLNSPRQLFLIAGPCVIENEKLCRTVAASRPAPTFEKDLSRVQHRLIAASKARVRCRNLGCINRSLNQLGSAVGVLGHAMFQCEQYVNVTRYGGYAFSSDGGASFGVSPAIDYTEEGDPVTNRVVVYVC